jgi:hypothetical protein
VTFFNPLKFSADLAEKSWDFPIQFSCTRLLKFIWHLSKNVCSYVPAYAFESMGSLAQTYGFMVVDGLFDGVTQAVASSANFSTIFTKKSLPPSLPIDGGCSD